MSVETVCRNERQQRTRGKRGLAPWHLQHLLRAGNFPRAKLDDSSVLLFVRSAPPTWCECLRPVGVYRASVVLVYLRTRPHTYARHQVGTRHAACRTPSPTRSRVESMRRCTRRTGCMCASTRNLYLIEARSGRR